MKIIQLIKKYKSFVAYVIFGILTTLVNIISYWLFYTAINLSNMTSTALSWVLATIFAFITNKLWVFDSKSTGFKTVLYELATFYMCRILTGVLDMVIMYITVDTMHLNAMFFKIISNIVVIILNYAASKLLIFSKGVSKNE